MLKKDLAKPHFQMVIAILRPTAFWNKVAGMGGYDRSEIGKLMA